ncbi:hypothetical protein A2U01_0092412, partial [Trifolium medium]|nr:hypothetical protein [Trifolium medium]
MGIGEQDKGFISGIVF